MLYIDDRAGSKIIGSGRDSADVSKEMVKFKVPCEVTRLEYGDYLFVGNGPNGDCTVALERKRLSDLLACIRDGRLSGHQLPGLLDNYHRVVLIVEGIYRPGADGLLEELRGSKWVPAPGRFMYREMQAYLTTLREICGIQIERVNSWRETIYTLATWYTWYQKPWADHKGHKMLHAPGLHDKEFGRSISLVQPTLLRKVASQLPGISDVRSKAIEKHFKTVFAMVNAGVTDWTAIDGIGKKIANDTIAAIHGDTLTKESTSAPQSNA